VGRSHECDFPPEVERLPACTSPKLNTNASSREIDREVKMLLENALSIYRIDTEQLKQLQPDVILTQSQCEVCAVSLKEVEDAVCHWLGSHPQIISLAPTKLADVWNDMVQVAQALGVNDRGTTLVKQLKARVVDIIEKACQLKRRPSVACIEWLDPLMAAGNWVPELVDLAAGSNLFGKAGTHSPWLDWDAVRTSDPAIIVVLPCGFDLRRTREELSVLTSQPGWNKLRAVRNHHVFLTDGNQYFNRPGPRLVESLEILAEILQPKIFHFGHEGKGWEKL
jgi:iron complex transport system substrate-binding protein